MKTLHLTKEQSSILSVALTTFYDTICKGPNSANQDFRNKVMEIHKNLVKVDD